MPSKGGVMLYLGHFTFIEYYDVGFNHGNFTAVVQADDIDNATVRLHTLLDHQKDKADLFNGRTFIFLEDIIEIKLMPEVGFIAHYAHYEGEPPTYTSTSIPGVSEYNCESYRPYPQFEDSTVPEEVDVVPFMTIDR